MVVVDDFHILEQDLVHTKAILNDFINALAPDDEVAIVFAGHSNLSQNFTTDRGLLLKAVEHVRAALGFGLDALGQSTSTLAGQNDARYIHAVAVRADWVLKNVVASLAGSGHPRRAIVYLTAGSIVPTVPNPDALLPDDFDDLQEVYQAARRADVPIYTIDPRGQVVPEEAIRGGIGAIGGLTPDSSTNLTSGRRALIAANIRLQNDRLAEIAINTGGRAFTNQSNLTRAVNEIVGDNGNYYLLGYYPSPFAADGKFHTFSVKVKRPGAHVRGRTGYVASTIEPATSTASPILDAAMSAGVNVSGVSLRAFAAPLAPGAKGMKTVLTVEVTYPPRPDAAREIDDDLKMNVLALDPDAKVKATSARTVSVKSTAPDGGSVTVLIDDLMELPPQPLTLRIGVVSRALGKAGSVQMLIEAPKTSDNKVQLSGVVVGTTNAPGATAIDAEAIKDLVPFQPTTSRTFAATDTLRVFAHAFWGSKDSAVNVTIGVAGPSTMAPRTIALTGARNSDGHTEGTLDTSVPLSGLAAGRYQLEIMAKLASGQTAKRVVPFEVK